MLKRWEYPIKILLCFKVFIDYLKLNRIIIKQKERERMSSDSESPQALSDPLPRTYSCFCEKIFTTYPGIYLHLKSKHANLFQKYKKLKITKLFRKIKQNDGSQIYRLDKLIQRENGNNNFHQKKFKLKNKQLYSDSQANNEKDLQAKLRENKRSLRSENIPSNSPKQQISKLTSQPSRQNFELAFKNYLKYQMPPNPYLGFPHAAQNPHFMSFPQFPPYQPFPNCTSESTIKKLMQTFLILAQERRIFNLKQLKDSLYDLMVFIDKNCEVIPDPRIKEKIVFSYCDQFGPKFIGLILSDFISQKQSLRLYDQEEEIKLREINYINNFSSWLREIGLLENIPQTERKEQKAVKTQKVYAFVEQEKN